MRPLFLTSTAVLALAGCTTTSLWSSSTETKTWDDKLGAATSEQSYINLTPAMDGSSVNAKKVKEYFCNGKKQSSRLSVTLQSINPTLRQGTTLDKAQEYRQRLVKNINEGLKLFFYSASVQVSNVQGGSFNRGAPFYLANLSDSQLVTLSTKVSLWPSDSDVAFMYNVANDRFYVFPNALAAEFDKRGGVRSFAVSKNMESALLINNFTLLIPKEKFEGRTEDVSIGKSLSNRDQIWKAYVQSMTSVKEAPSKDGQSLTYQLDIDLNGFCEYGQSNNDLTAK